MRKEESIFLQSFTVILKASSFKSSISPLMDRLQHDSGSEEPPCSPSADATFIPVSASSAASLSDCTRGL